MAKLRFVDSTNASFLSTVKSRVDDYFKENNISKNANSAMIFKSTIFLSGFALIYFTILSGYFSNQWINLLLTIPLGIFGAFIGFNVSHDAIHGSYSSKKLVNKVLSISFNFIGASPYIWKLSHNIVHHTYTNIPGHDEDIEVAPGLVRLSPEDQLTSMQKYQHFYAFLLYGLASISWVFRKDYKKFFQKKIGESTFKHPRIEYFNLFFFKAMYYVLFIVLPLTLLPINLGQWFLGFVLMHISQGLVLGLVFQLAHVVEGTDFPVPNENLEIADAWAAHQMRTTANFARKNTVANYLCGGLNMQIEHHLFPNICHIHYAQISDIVKSTALEFELPYLENESFYSALQSHYRMLKKFGIEEWNTRKVELLKA